MSRNEFLMLLAEVIKYVSAFTGAQIDEAIAMVRSGLIQRLAANATAAAQRAESALQAVRDALSSLPAGAVLVINDLTTGGSTAALSAQQGVVLKDMVDTTRGELAPIISDRGPTASDAGIVGQRWLDTAHGNIEYTCTAASGGSYTWVYSGPVNKNLMDNPYFAAQLDDSGNQVAGTLPVNQRGFSTSSSTASAYTIDRWKKDGNCTVTLTEDGIEFTPNATDKGYYQLFATTDDILNRQVTLSALVKAETTAQVRLGFGGGGGYQALVDIGSDWTLVTYTHTFTVGTGFVIRAQEAGKKIIIKAAKLELGDRQTGWHQDMEGNWVLNEIPDYGEELAKCQKYLRPLPKNSAVSLSGHVNNNGNAAYITLPFEMAKKTGLSLVGVKASNCVVVVGNLTIMAQDVSVYSSDEFGVALQVIFNSIYTQVANCPVSCYFMETNPLVSGEL